MFRCQDKGALGLGDGDAAAPMVSWARRRRTLQFVTDAVSSTAAPVQLVFGRFNCTEQKLYDARTPELYFRAMCACNIEWKYLRTCVYVIRTMYTATCLIIKKKPNMETCQPRNATS